MTKPSRLTFEVIDKNHKDAAGVPDFLKLITTRELGMLVRMLDDLQHGSAEDTKKAYGWAEDPAKWDLVQLELYKEEVLRDRMETKEHRFGGLTNYTFFLLKDENDQTVALASGNAYDHKMQLRLLNVTVHPDHREEGLSAELMKRVSHWAKQHDFPKIVVPLSEHALAKGNAMFYRKMALGLGLAIEDRPHFNIDTGKEDRKAREMSIAPELFKSLEPGNQPRDATVPGNPVIGF